MGLEVLFVLRRTSLIYYYIPLTLSDASWIFEELIFADKIDTELFYGLALMTNLSGTLSCPR